MLIYLIIFAAITGCYFYTYKRGGINAKGLALIMTFLAIFVGISDMLGGYDRYIYGELFDEVADNLNSGSNIFNSNIFYTYSSEFSYGILNVIIAFFTANRYIFIFILILLTYALLFISFRKYCYNYPFALIIFLAIMFFFTFTYLRQILAACIVWLSIKYIIERKFLKFMGILLLAATIHNSAVLFLPMYFIPIKKYNRNVIILVMAVCLAIGISGIPSNLFDTYEIVTGNTDRAGMYIETFEQGLRIEYLLEVIFFMSIIISYYSKIPNTRIHILMLNIAIMFCMILLIFINSENGGRMGWIFFIGIISILTYIATETKKVTKHGVILISVCFLLFLRILITWNILLFPYKTFFTSGIRENDYIEKKYEYDHLYDHDKFYR